METIKLIGIGLAGLIGYSMLTGGNGQRTKKGGPAKTGKPTPLSGVSGGKPSPTVKQYEISYPQPKNPLPQDFFTPPDTPKPTQKTQKNVKVIPSSEAKKLASQPSKVGGVAIKTDTGLTGVSPSQAEKIMKEKGGKWKAETHEPSIDVSEVHTPVSYGQPSAQQKEKSSNQKLAESGKNHALAGRVY